MPGRLFIKIFTITVTLLFLPGCCDKSRISENINALYSPDARVRNQATLDLANCGSDAARAVPRLAELLYDPNVGVQSGAAFALNKIDTQEARDIMDRAMQAKRNRKTE